MVRDDPIADDFVLYNSPHFDITTNNFNDGSLKLKLVVNDRAEEEFSLSRQIYHTVVGGCHNSMVDIEASVLVMLASRAGLL